MVVICQSLMHFGVGHSSTPLTFFSFIFILSGLITTLKNPTSFTFYLYFSGFMYKLFSSNLLITSTTILSCSFSVSVPTMISSMKAATFLVLIRSLSNSFIIVWNVAGKLVRPKNMTRGLNDLSGIVNTALHLSLSFILTLLYPYLRSIFVKTFFVPIFSRISNIRGSR